MPSALRVFVTVIILFSVFTVLAFVYGEITAIRNYALSTMSSNAYAAASSIGMVNAATSNYPYIVLTMLALAPLAIAVLYAIHSITDRGE